MAYVDDEKRWYFFRGHQYWIKKKGSGKIVNGPFKIHDKFPKEIPLFVDAAFYDARTESDCFWFFKGDRIWQVKKANYNQAEEKNISDEFPGIPSDIDAATYDKKDSDGKEAFLFFKDEDYYTLDKDLSADSLVKRSIKDDFPLFVELNPCDHAETAAAFRNRVFSGDTLLILNAPHDEPNEFPAKYARSKINVSCTPLTGNDENTWDVVRETLAEFYAKYEKALSYNIAMVRREFIDFNRTPDCAWPHIDSKSPFAEHYPVPPLVYEDYLSNVGYVARGEDERQNSILFDIHGFTLYGKNSRATKTRFDAGWTDIQIGIEGAAEDSMALKITNGFIDFLEDKKTKDRESVEIEYPDPEGNMEQYVLAAQNAEDEAIEDAEKKEGDSSINLPYRFKGGFTSEGFNELPSGEVGIQIELSERIRKDAKNWQIFCKLFAEFLHKVDNGDFGGE